MKKNDIKVAAWAHAKDKRYDDALEIVLTLEHEKDRGDLLIELLDYYLQQVIPGKHFVWSRRQELSNDSRLDISGYFQAAYDIIEKVDLKRRSVVRKKIIAAGKEYLKKSDSPVNERIDLLYEIASDVIIPADMDAFAKLMIRACLSTPAIKGAEIFRVLQLMSAEAKLTEAKRLLPIFIDRGDYEVLKLLGKKYEELEKIVFSQPEKIIRACLKQGNRYGAVEALPLVKDADKRREYCERLGVDFK